MRFLPFPWVETSQGNILFHEPVPTLLFINFVFFSLSTRGSSPYGSFLTLWVCCLCVPGSNLFLSSLSQPGNSKTSMVVWPSHAGTTG